MLKLKWLFRDEPGSIGVAGKTIILFIPGGLYDDDEICVCNSLAEAVWVLLGIKNEEELKETLEEFPEVQESFDDIMGEIEDNIKRLGIKLRS